MSSRICDLCGNRIPAAANVIDRLHLCRRCRERYTVPCRECGTRIWKTDNFGDPVTALCRDCYDWRYTRCHGCGALLRTATACYESSDTLREHPYCDPCFARLSPPAAIHPYNYKPVPIFFGDGPRYFGVELEIDGGGESAENARQLLAIGNQSAEHIYIKRDGSLRSGFEIATHPMSLDYHLHQMPWVPLCRKAIALGYRSHSTTTCGLHIHINRTSFGATEAAQDAAIGRLLYFFEKNWAKILQFSRRTPQQAARWAARYGHANSPQSLLEQAKKVCNERRYQCINLLPKETVEVRIFRGTLKYTTLAAALQLVDRICDMALYLSDEEVKAMSWTTFAGGCQAPELVQYLKERQSPVGKSLL